MKTHKLIRVIVITVFLSACAQHDPWADRRNGATGGFGKGKDYEFFQPSLLQIARMRVRGEYVDTPMADDPNKAVRVTDADVLTYSDHVKGIFRAKFTNARIARYVSSTTQVALIAAAGIAGVTNAGATTIAALTLGTTVPPQLSDIFHAADRAKAYQQAAANIETAEAAFYSAKIGTTAVSDVPSRSSLSKEGADLYAKVATQIEGAEAAVQGQLPAVMAALPTPAASASPTK